MLDRRTLFITAAGVALLPATFAAAQTQSRENGMVYGRKAMRGPANRSLMALEETWVKTRFYAEAMMEEGRVPREVWVKAKLNVIHGNFDIRDPDDGAVLQKVEKGVRVQSPP
jgi:hypothetical protein